MQNIPKRDFTNMTKKQEQLIEDEILLDSDEELLDDQDELEEDTEEETFEDEEEDLEEQDTKENGTEAAATLRPNSKPAGSKSEMMSTIQNAMSGMSGGDMIKFFELAMGAYKEFPQKIPDGTAERNKGSIAAVGKPVKEDLEALFGGDSEELSEELREKIATLFEAAVNSNLQVQIARIEEEYEEKLEEEVTSLSEQLQEDVESYLDYVAGNWLEENQVAVESSLRAELTESFINDLGQLCRSYNLDLPEGDDDLIEQLTNKVEELEDALNETEAKNIELGESVVELRKEVIVEEMADAISPVHYKKFKTLAENIEYDGDDEKFVKKLEYIKEGFFGDKKATPSSNIINEQIAEDAEDVDTKTFEHPDVRQVYNAISRTATKQ